ncbi:methyltransferase domain-containing protein [Actinoplanes sp. NPDC023714]|uniref:class I SAM-dependent methyltransferase n=1 Tax=Actinoplanes sp. NPDC023714 TaxID=3154322 RepID=UPI0033D059FF
MDPFSRSERRGRAAGYDRLLADRLLDAAGAAPGMRVLDLACGPGALASRATMRGCRPTGLDPAPDMVALARSRQPAFDSASPDAAPDQGPRADETGVGFAEVDAARAGLSRARGTFAVGRVEALPFRDGVFDVVAGNFLLRHPADPVPAVAEAARVLKPGGRLALSLRDLPDRALLEGAGFTGVTAGTYDFEGMAAAYPPGLATPVSAVIVSGVAGPAPRR